MVLSSVLRRILGVPLVGDLLRIPLINRLPIRVRGWLRLRLWDSCKLSICINVLGHDEVRA